MGDLGYIPEPTGPPEPVTNSERSAARPWKRVARGLAGAGIVLTVAGGTVFLVAASVGLSSSRGATRSARLVWQQRQAEIEQTIAEAERPGAGNGASPARGAR